MKKIVLWIVAIVLIIGASIAAFMKMSTNDKESALKPIEDPIFLYVNIGQLASKGAFDKFITPENRSLISTVLSSQFDSAKEAEHLKNIITNLEAIGIDTHVPIYGYLADNLNDCVVVATVLDITQIDRSVALISYLLEQNGEDAISILNEDDMRMFEYNGVAVVYNSDRVALAIGDSDTIIDIAKDAINRPQMDMSVFGESDIALLVNTDRCVQLASEHVNNEILVLNEKYNAGEIGMERYSTQTEVLVERDELILSYATYFEPNSNILLSTTFDLGRMTLAYSSKGINFGEYAGIGKSANMEHLSNLSKDTYAVMGVGVDGTILAQFVRNVLNGDMLQSVGITPTNEINMFVSIACDALSTIDGGVTLAIEEIDGEIKPQYNHYWDEYYIEPAIKSVKAMLLADVTDTYIISNIAQFAGGFLRKVDSTHYTLRLMNYNFSMGQDDNLFHLGVNTTPQVATPSVLDTEWAKDIEGTMGYVAVNVDALMASKFMKSTNKYISTQIMEEYRELYHNATELVSYVYASVDSLESAEVVVVFDDKSVNALEQINALILPALVNEGLKSLF